MGVNRSSFYIATPGQTKSGSLSGANFTALASIPAGAGVIPAANLPGAASGGWTFLSKQTPSGAASVDFTSITAYKAYLLLINGLTLSVDTQLLKMTLNGDTGNNYEYIYADASFHRAVGQSGYALSTDTGTKMGIGGMIMIQGVAIATEFFAISGTSSTGEAGAPILTLGGSWQKGTDTQISQITLTPVTGTISGEVALYGNSDL